MPRVELVYDRDCPHVQEARAELLRAFEQARVPARWQEWERSAPESPSYVRHFGSPSVLVDGKDVEPMHKMEGVACCRIYADDAGTRPTPSAEQMAVRLLEAARPARSGSGWRSAGGVLPGASVALLPKLVCPACWPAYAALVSSLGLGFLLQNRYLLGLTSGFLLLALAALWWRAKERRGYRPLLLAVGASAAILVGKFGLESRPVWWAGAALLVAACVWNGWPRRAACPACAISEQT